MDNKIIEHSAELKELSSVISYDKETGKFKWRKKRHGVQFDSEPGCKCVQGYWNIRIFGKKYRAHRLAWLLTYGQWPDEQIDHIDGDRTNNHIENLREVRNAENSQNRGAPKAGSQSRYLGVSFDKRMNKWMAQICVGGKAYNLGRFDTPEQASERYIAAKKEMHPFFAQAYVARSAN